MLSEKWILGFFHSDGSGSTMSGIHHRFIGQHKQAAADVLYQFVEIASGQVGTADASLKQNITAEHAFFLFAVIHHAARRVSRNMDGFQLGISETDNVTIHNVFPQRDGLLIDGKAEHAGLHGGLFNPEFILLAAFGLQVELA